MECGRYTLCSRSVLNEHVDPALFTTMFACTLHGLRPFPSLYLRGGELMLQLKDRNLQVPLFDPNWCGPRELR